MAKWWWCYTNECPCKRERDRDRSENCGIELLREWEWRDGEEEVEEKNSNCYTKNYFQYHVHEKWHRARSSLWMKIYPAATLSNTFNTSEQADEGESGVVSVADVVVCEGGFVENFPGLTWTWIFLSSFSSFIALLLSYESIERRSFKYEATEPSDIEFIVWGGCICDCVSIMRNKTFSNKGNDRGWHE